MKLLLVGLYPETTPARYLLGIACLKAWLDGPAASGWDVQPLYAPSGTPAGDLRERILAAAPDAVGYGCYVWNTRTILETLADWNPGVPQILGGPEVSADWLDALPADVCVDYAVEAEGEQPLADLLQHLARQGAERPATCWARTAGGWTPGRGTPTDLAALPSAYESGSVPASGANRRMALIETQRGCPRRCGYCLYHRKTRGVRYRPADSVRRELDHVIDTVRPLWIRFCDANFASDEDRALAVVAHLLDRQRDMGQIPQIFWEFGPDVSDRFLRAIGQLEHHADGPYWPRLAPADRSQVYGELAAHYTSVNSVGLQSLNPEALRAVHRPATDQAAVRRFVETCTNAGLLLKLDLILGLPFEAAKSWQQTVECLTQLLGRADHILNIHVLRVLPGTAIHADRQTLGIETVEPSHCVTSTPQMPPEVLDHLVRVSAVLCRTFNSPLRPAMVDAAGRTDGSCWSIAEALLRQLREHPAMSDTALLADAPIDDDYWTDPLYANLPSAVLQSFLDTL